MPQCKTIFARTLPLAMLLAGFCMSAPAQDFAVLTGTVTDPAGAPVAGVKLTVLNEATNLSNQTQTSDQGDFRVAYLSPGSYTVTCEAAGFKQFSRKSVLLASGQNGFIPIHLVVGDVAETLTVTAEAPLLEATTATRGSVIDARQLAEVPQPNRNAIMLALIGVGVTWRGGSAQAFANGSTAEWTVNGSPEKKADFLLDGAPNNSWAGDNNIAYMPSVDSVEELRIHTNSYDAEYGKTAGGVLSFTTKSGTNTPHGTIYQFAQRTAMEANSFSNNANRVARTPTYLNQYGFVLGGPVYLPKVYNGKNRSFFMISLENYHQNLPWPITASVPAPEMLTGDFSKLKNSAGQLIAIADPTSGHVDATGTYIRDVFAGNQIPQNRINPIAKNILSYYGKPTRDAGPGLGYTQNNYFYGGTNVYPYYALTIKADQNFGSRNRLSYRFVKGEWKPTNWNGSNGIFGTPGATAHYGKRSNDADSLNWVSTLNPRTVLSVRASWNQFIEGSTLPENFGFDAGAKFGLPASLVAQLPDPQYFGVHSFSGYTGLGGGGTLNTTNSFAFHPQISVMYGRHSLKAGVDARLTRYTGTISPNTWGYSASAGFTQKNYQISDGLSGNSIASFLLGAPSGGSATWNIQPLYSIPYYAPYVQDDWRIGTKLTLNLGLRWDFNIAPSERFNRLLRGFADTTASPLTQSVNLAQFPSARTQLLGGLLYAGVNGTPSRTFNTTHGNIQPRLGAAYQMSDRLVLRGGWARYYLNANNASLLNNGFTQSTSITASNDGGQTPVPGVMSNPFPQGVLAPQGSSAGLLSYVGNGLTFANPDFTLPHADIFTLGFQYRLPFSSVIEMSYVGNRTPNQQVTNSYNEISLAVRQSCDPAEGGNPNICNANLPNPFKGNPAFIGNGYYTSSTLTYSQLMRPFPQFGGVNQVMANGAKTWYNGAQIAWQSKQWKHANFNVNYTYSKTMMTGYSAWYGGSNADYVDVQNKILNRSIYEGDMTHQFKAAVVYNLPFGKNFRLANGPVLSRLVGGWQLSTFFRYNSGVPMTLPNGYMVKDPFVKNIDWKAQQVKVYNSCVAQWNNDGSITMLPYSVAQGCTSYNWLTAPSYAPSRVVPYVTSQIRTHTTPVADMMLAKATTIHERVNLQVRLEAFNVTNTANSAGNFPDTGLTSSSFGTFARASGGSTYPGIGGWNARIVQIGGKLNW